MRPPPASPHRRPTAAIARQLGPPTRPHIDRACSAGRAAAAGPPPTWAMRAQRTQRLGMRR